LGGAIYSLVSWLDAHATDAEVSAVVQKHDESAGAHVFLHDRVMYLSREDERNRVVRKDLESLYWILVGHHAASEHPHGNPKDVARDARKRFDDYVAKGDPLPTAFRKAIGRD